MKPGNTALRSITIALLLTACLSSCVEAPPPIGRHQGSTYTRGDFDQRVRERFPVGTDAKELLIELKKEGFKIRDGVAVFDERQGVCDTTWSLQWSATNGKITAITGDFFPICL